MIYQGWKVILYTTLTNSITHWIWQTRNGRDCASKIFSLKYVTDKTQYDPHPFPFFIPFSVFFFLYIFVLKHKVIKTDRIVPCKNFSWFYHTLYKLDNLHNSLFYFNEHSLCQILACLLLKGFVYVVWYLNTKCP